MEMHMLTFRQARKKDFESRQRIEVVAAAS